MLRRMMRVRMEFGSSSCRVTGVSSLNLARRPYGLAGFFLFGHFVLGAPAQLLTERRLI